MTDTVLSGLARASLQVSVKPGEVQFVRPTAQRTGVGLPLVHHILDVARSMGYQRVDIWTAETNGPARGLYERSGMSPTGKTAPLQSSLALQYEGVLNDRALSRD